MSEQLKGFTVTFEKDVCYDDAEDMRKAILMVKGVCHVSPMIVEHVDIMAREKARGEVRTELWEAFKKILYGR